jgi:hypothetical protein
MLFLKGLNRCDILRVAITNACSTIEVLLVALVFLQETLIDTTLVGISPTGDIDAFVWYVLIDTLGFLTQVLAH